MKRFPQVIRPVLVLLVVVACAAPPTPLPTATSVSPTATSAPPTLTPAPAATPVVIDADMAADDLMAILYLLMRPDVSVKAVTVTGTGLAYCVDGTRHALGLVALAGGGDIPVACGREEPLQGHNAFPSSWRSATKSFPGLTLPEGGTVSDQTAVELLISTIESSPQKVVLLTLGPLTNVAEALQHCPELVENLQMIYIMGGAIDVPGVIANRLAEWNIWVDPHAANLVLESGAPIRLVPLDATNMVPVTRSFYEALEDNHFTPEATAVFDLLTGTPTIYLGGGIYFWDQLTAAILADESLTTFETRRLSVIEEGSDEIGRTLKTADGAEVRVAVSADALRFEQEFLSTLNGGVEVTIAPRTARVTITQRAPEVAITPPAEFDWSGCTYDDPESLPVGLLGIWRLSEGHARSPTGEFYLQLNENGTHRGAGAVDTLEDDPLVVGQFCVEGEQIAFQQTSWRAWGGCLRRGTGIYEIQLAPQERLSFVVIFEPCHSRSSDITSSPFVWVPR
jgi:inosine-uridine nucleoside N-ribohydrolase